MPAAATTGRARTRRSTFYQELRGYVEAGFTAVKIKVGRLPLEQELRRVRKAREAIGPDTILMMDANNAWPDAAAAIPAIRALAEVNPFWVEEPLMPDDIRGHAAIREKVSVPIATGEIEATRWGFAALLEQGSADMLQPDATVLGGITEFCKVAGMASGRDVPLYPHWMHHLPRVDRGLSSQRGHGGVLSRPQRAEHRRGAPGPHRGERRYSDSVARARDGCRL